jgi:hypothetical protein
MIEKKRLEKQLNLEYEREEREGANVVTGGGGEARGEGVGKGFKLDL